MISKTFQDQNIHPTKPTKPPMHTAPVDHRLHPTTRAPRRVGSWVHARTRLSPTGSSMYEWSRSRAPNTTCKAVKNSNDMSMDGINPLKNMFKCSMMRMMLVIYSSYSTYASTPSTPQPDSPSNCYTPGLPHRCKCTRPLCEFELSAPWSVETDVRT